MRVKDDIVRVCICTGVLCTIKKMHYYKNHNSLYNKSLEFKLLYYLINGFNLTMY